MKCPKLEKWYLVELTHPVLIGNVGKFKDVMTDYIIEIKDNFAYTKNESFELGTPDKVWAKSKGYLL